jgi:hypothetical protein
MASKSLSRAHVCARAQVFIAALAMCITSTSIGSDDPSQLTNIGWDDIIAEHALVIVEWPERAGSRMRRIISRSISINVADDPDRRILLAG